MVEENGLSTTWMWYNWSCGDSHQHMRRLPDSRISTSSFLKHGYNQTISKAFIGDICTHSEVARMVAATASTAVDIVGEVIKIPPGVHSKELARHISDFKMVQGYQLLSNWTRHVTILFTFSPFSEGSMIAISNQTCYSTVKISPNITFMLTIHQVWYNCKAKLSATSSSCKTLEFDKIPLIINNTPIVHFDN